MASSEVSGHFARSSSTEMAHFLPPSCLLSGSEVHDLYCCTRMEKRKEKKQQQKKKEEEEEEEEQQQK